MNECARGSRGSSLLECVLAVAVGGIGLGGVASALQACTTTIAGVQRSWDALDAARNVLETSLGMPCAQSYECPPEFQCELRRTTLAAAIDRIGVTVTSPDLPARIRLDTLVRPPDCAVG